MKEREMRAKLKYILSTIDSVFQPVESHDTGKGIPDIFYCCKGHTGWIELKQGKLLSNGSVKVRYQPHQIHTLNRYKFFNPFVFSLISIHNDVYLQSTNFRENFNCLQELKAECIYFGELTRLLLEVL